MRALLAFWQARRGPHSQPPRTSFLAEELMPWWPDLVLHDVVAGPAGPRFRFRVQGTRVEQIDRGQFTGRFLDEVVAPARHGIVLEGYHRCLEARAPVYTVREAHDRIGRPVVFERLILPLGPDGAPPSQLLVCLMVHSDGAYFEREGVIRDEAWPAAYLVRAIITP